jgi:hypothetical protein
VTGVKSDLLSLGIVTGVMMLTSMTGSG